MNIHEFQAKEILRDYDINVAKGATAENLEQVGKILDELNGEIFAVKAQIHAGGRGLVGGVKIAKSRKEALNIASNMFGMRLVTLQTPKEGILVNKIYIEEGLNFKQEIYLSLTFDRNNENISLIVSKNGGVGIEETAKTNPKFIKAIGIDPQIGLRDFHTKELIEFLQIDKILWVKLDKLLKNLYKIYISKDANLIEINPLVLTQDDEFYALDAKMSFDDSALFRHADIAALNDETQSDPDENTAKRQRLNYIKLDGNVGCVVNGAGLAMATMDIIKELGANAANFLDVGGSATGEGVAKAFKLILNDNRVKVVFVNIFGGIVRCDRIAEGIIDACESIKPSVPVVVRFDGTNAEKALEMLKNSALDKLYASADLFEGAKLAVELAKVKK
ncbi:MAG: ADP-forming succinate--CoA ligase subunit beta [Campylobacter sp.]|nr:ADP-forming succinate--CoA ligase subunit beta [Campylobacter sp.]